MLKTKRLHTTALLQGLILLGLSTANIRLLLSGEIFMYISPQMVPFAWFGAGVMGVMAILALADVRKIPRGHTYLSTYVLFGFPLLTMLVFTPIALTSADLPGRSMDPGFALDHGAGGPEPGTSGMMPSGVTEIYTGEGPLGDLYDLDVSEEDLGLADSEPIDITPDNFYLWVNELYQNPAAYEGRDISVEGFVHRDEAEYIGQDTGDTEAPFWVSRFLMVCCVADVVLVGFPVDDPEGTQIPSEAWIRVDGVLKVQTRDESPVPLIQSESISYIEQPAHPYVFPF